ncbi:hypothetical protein PR001_g27516 [Phytophthora rubi]|uniref:Elicitin-like protein n=1 Tax=Phytophthora rubi TaxID=129364 RepID=A0A6A3HIA8_9STRA|nr:hypothetical protein PR001_g27516 [Phytophthora rubi]
MRPQFMALLALLVLVPTIVDAAECTDAEAANADSVWAAAANTSACSPYVTQTNPVYVNAPCTATDCVAVVEGVAKNLPDCTFSGINNKIERATRPAASFILQFSINTKDAEEEDQAARSPPVVGQSCWQALRSTIVTFDGAPQAEASYRHGAGARGARRVVLARSRRLAADASEQALEAVVKPRAIKRTKAKLPKLKRKRRLRKEARGEVTAAKRSSVPAHQELVAPLLQEQEHRDALLERKHKRCCLHRGVLPF